MPPRVRITKEFTFEAAHVLEWHQGKCGRVHGHSYKLQVTVSAPLNEYGIVTDFSDLKAAVNAVVINELDHTHLNKLIPNPTGENIALWIWGQVAYVTENWRDFTNITLERVRLWETATAFVSIDRGD